jgi:hypothetical protein
LRKSRLLELYARGYPKESITKFATHSSEKTTFAYYVSDHGFDNADYLRSEVTLAKRNY